MNSCYDRREQSCSGGSPVDGRVDPTSNDLERAVIEAVREHRRLLAHAEQKHRDWQDAVATAATDERAAELLDDYRASLFEARAQQMRLAGLLDRLGRIPELDEDEEGRAQLRLRSNGMGEN